MRFTRTLGLLVLAAVLALVISPFSTPPAQASASGVVISAVYGGGASSTAGVTFTRDYIELFNAGAAAVNIGNWSVQYSGNGNNLWSGKVNIPADTVLEPGQYYLIITGNTGGAGATIPVAADIDTTINMSASNGSVAIASNTTTLDAGASDPDIVDLMGYGTGTVESETSSTAALNISTGATRNTNGCTDTDNNASDFTLVSPAPNPRNSATTFAPCGPPPPDPVLVLTSAESADPIPSSATVTYTFTSSNTGAATSDALLTVQLSGPIASFTTSANCTALDSDSLNCALGALTSTPVDSTVTVTPSGEGTLTANGTLTATDAADATSGQSTTVSDASGCGAPADNIYDFQENGTLFGAGGTRTFEGVVTGDFQLASPNGLGGFYMQQEVGDGNPATSDGIWVILDAATFDVVLGERVRLTGTPGETFGQTRVNSITNPLRCGTGSITPTPITLPMPLATRENYEGMLVTVTSSVAELPLTVNEAYQLERFGEIRVGVGRRYQPTTIVEPGAAANLLRDENTAALLLVDDTRDGQPPAGSVPYIGMDGSIPFRMGSTTTEITGVMGFGFSNYRLQPTVAPTWTLAPRPTSAPDVGGRVQVASFNVLNFFNGNGLGGGFPTPRGADTLSEYNRQLNKLVIALDGLDADVIGLMEIENDGGANQALESLVVALNNYDNANNNNNDWAFIDAGVIGTDEIKVAYLYDASRVAPEGVFDVLDNVAPFNVNNRPPLAQTFRELDTDQTFTVVVNHFKSKGSCPASGADADQGDGQGCWNATRITAAEVMLDWFEGSLGTNSFDVADTENIIVIGDLNSYALEDPIDVLKAAGYSDLLREFNGSNTYGYVFDAVSGYLDYALVNANLHPYVTGAADWHINADEPLGRDYDQDFSRQPEFYQLNEFRTSDHDPVLMGFTTPGTLGALNVPTPVTVGAPLVVTITDPDWTRTSIEATITTANGDSETLTLAVTGTPGEFSGSITTAAGTANLGNGTLEVTTPETVTVTYNDPLNAAGVAQVVTANATVQAASTSVTGSIDAPATAVPGDDAITVTVTDADLITSATVTATTTGGDSETLTLNGTAGTFSLTLNTGVGPATASNGTLETVDGDVITFTYTDTQDASGGTTNVTATTTVAAANNPGSFTLTSPANAALITDVTVTTSITWTDATDSKAYTLTLTKLSGDAPLGVVATVGVDASDACASGVCTYTLAANTLSNGGYEWTVIADGVGAADVTASNAPFTFTVDTETVQGTELVTNGGFELGRANNPKRPVDWEAANLTLDRRQCNGRGNGSDCALIFRGNENELSTFTQTLDFTGFTNESITLSADINTDRPNPGRLVILLITYVDPTAGAAGTGVDRFVLRPRGAATDTYITYTVDGVLDGEVASASVRVQYRKLAGTIRVDNVSVLVGGSGAPRSTVLPMPEAPGN